jgi:hypothetical protein
MTRETVKSDGVGFNWAVYGSSGMAKETVGCRVPVAIAEQVGRYADTHDLTKTDTIELFIRTGLREPEEYTRKHVYTGEIRENWHPEPPHRESTRRDDDIEGRVKRKLQGAESYTGEWEENTALTARLPGEVVRGIEEWAESQDQSKSVAAADLLKRGLWADPLPDGYTGRLGGESYTVELESEKADTFRRYRLAKRYTPSEAVSALLGASRSTKSVRPDWGQPGDE